MSIQNNNRKENQLEHYTEVRFPESLSNQQQYLTTPKVAYYLQTTGSTIRNLKERGIKAGYLLEGDHWIKSDSHVYWTYRGLIKLAYKLKPSNRTLNFQYEIEDTFLAICEKTGITPITILEQLINKTLKGKYTKAKEELEIIKAGSIEVRCVYCQRLLEADESKARHVGHTCWRKKMAERPSQFSMR